MLSRSHAHLTPLLSSSTCGQIRWLNHTKPRNHAHQWHCPRRKRMTTTASYHLSQPRRGQSPSMSAPSSSPFFPPPFTSLLSLHPPPHSLHCYRTATTKFLSPPMSLPKFVGQYSKQLPVQIKVTTGYCGPSSRLTSELYAKGRRKEPQPPTPHQNMGRYYTPRVLGKYYNELLYCWICILANLNPKQN